ncbi:phage terminase small subunit [Nocardia sp. NPDC055002]
MGSRGPVPKRSDERIRRNNDGPIDKIEVVGSVDIPELGMDDPHPLVVDIYDSLIESAQSRYYEASDWTYAKFALHFADGLLKSSRPSAQLLVSVNQMFTDLLVSEGSRRRVKLEIERNQSTAKVLDFTDRLLEKLQ